MKTFVFGRRKDDPKGPPEEHGEVTIEAPSLGAARAEFIKQCGERDVRQHIVRALDVATAPPKARTRKR